MARQNIARGALANDRQGDTFRAGAQKLNETLVELYLKLGGDSDQLMSNVQFTDSSIEFGTTFKTRFIGNVATSADRRILLPDASGTIVLTDDSATFENKTLQSPNLILPRIYDSDSDNYGTVKFAGNLDSNKTLIIPLLSDSNDTFVFRKQAQTLTNKTLTTPTISSPIISGEIDDANGAVIIGLTPATGAQNYINITNADSATINPLISAAGADSDISVRINAKNGGAVRASKIAYRGQTITADGTVDRTVTFVDINSGIAVAIALPDGVVNYEKKIFANRGAGTATITPTNFAQGTSFDLAQNEGCELIWNGSNWFLTGNQSVVTIT